jgi:Na+-transporting NADH:ubiquinone oxidoreductase subunit C
VVDFNGEKVEGLTAFNVDMAKELVKTAEERLYPVYEARLENGEVKYILQMRGAGLWGPIWGYLSVNDDGNTVYGSTFGHKGETPGLGAEIDKADFQKQFEGKQIFNAEGKLVSISVVKAGASLDNPHMVDGISGGTITSKGVGDMLGNFLKGYENLLKKINSESHE